MLASTSPRVSVRKTTSTLGKGRDRSTQQGSVSSLPPYSELYSPISSKGARLGLDIGTLEREESDGEEEVEEEGEEGPGRAHQPPPPPPLGTTPTRSSTLPATTHILLSSPSPSTRSFHLTPSRSPSTYTSYHLTSPRPQPPPAINTSSSPSTSLLEESSSDDGSFESPVTQLDRLLLRSSSALATAQTLLSGTLTARGSLLDLDERGREGDDSLSRIDVETRLRTRRDSELYTTRIDPLFNSISLLLSDLERQTPYVSSYASHPLRTRLSAVGTSLGSVQQVDASYIPSSNPFHQRSNSHINLPSSPNGGPDDTSSVQPPPQSPATSLLHSLHGRTSSVSSGKSFFLSPPPSSPISRFAFPTPASSPPTQTRFPSTTFTSSSTSTSKDRTPDASSRDQRPTTSTTTFSSPPQPRSSHPTPSLHPSPSLDRMFSSSSTTANCAASTSPTRPRTVSTSAALVGGSLSSSNRDSPNVNSLTLQIPFSSYASSTSSSSRHPSPSPSEADEDTLLTSLLPAPGSGPIRHRRSQSPLPPSSARATPTSAFRTSASPSPTPVSATTTPTMSTVSLPSTSSTSNASPIAEKKVQLGSAVLGNESVAMARLRSLGALKPAVAAAVEGSASSTSSEGPPPVGSESSTGAVKKWGVPGWFGS